MGMSILHNTEHIARMCTHYGHSYCAPLESAFLLHIFVSVTPIPFSAIRHKCQIPQMFGTALPSTWDALPQILVFSLSSYRSLLKCHIHQKNFFEYSFIVTHTWGTWGSSVTPYHHHLLHYTLATM